MRKIVLSTVFALGMGIAASTGASATPLSTGLSTGAVAVPNASLIEDVALICRRITVCHHRYGRRVCRVERVCRHRW